MDDTMDLSTWVWMTRASGATSWPSEEIDTRWGPSQKCHTDRKVMIDMVRYGKIWLYMVIWELYPHANHMYSTHIGQHMAMIPQRWGDNWLGNWSTKTWESRPTRGADWKIWLKDKGFQWISNHPRTGDVNQDPLWSDPADVVLAVWARGCPKSPGNWWNIRHQHRQGTNWDMKSGQIWPNQQDSVDMFEKNQGKPWKT